MAYVQTLHLQAFSTALLIIALSACSTQPIATGKIADWNSYQQQLKQETHWRLSAKMGVRSPEKSGSAYLQWQQLGDNYQIHISGPLGQGSTWIRRNEQNIRLERAGEITLRANSADELLRQAVGWNAPLEQLKYWVRGLPAPNIPATIHHNSLGTMATLEQSGWQLEYSRYIEHGRYQLPTKIIAHHQDLRLTLIVKDWLIEP